MHHPIRQLFPFAFGIALLAGCGESDSAAPRSEAVVGAIVEKGLAQRARRSAQVVADPVRGMVVDLAGQPVSRAHVTLFERTREWPRSGRRQLHSPVWTGADGRFEFGISRRRHLEVRVEAGGYATTEIMPAAKVADLTIELAPGFQVRGRVLDPEGAPCRSCDVYLESRAGRRMRALEAKTDAQGEFGFQGVPADTFRLVARHPDYQPAESDLVIVGTRHVHALQFADANGLRAAGTVRGVDGALLEGCDVLVYPSRANGLLTVPYQTRTGPEGRFQVAGLKPGAYTMEVRHPDFSTEQRLLSLKSSSSTGLEVELGVRIPVRGKITGLDEPAGVELWITSFFGEFGTTRLGSDGSFEFPGKGFSQGLATLELEEGVACFAGDNSRWTQIRLRDDESEDFTLSATAPTVLDGVVQDADGQPIPGVEVVTNLNLWREIGALKLRPRVLAVTDENGRYQVYGIEPGTVSLGFRKQQFAFQQQTARVAELTRVEQRVVQLSRPGAIAGRVTSSGRPVVGALVTAGRGVRARKTHTDRDGRYQLSGVTPGRHRIHVKLGSLPSMPSRRVTVEPGETVADVDVQLPSRRVRGVVADKEDAPMPQMIVEAPSGLTAETDKNGYFELDVPPQRTVLSVRLRRDAPVTERFVCDPKDRGELSLVVKIAPRAELTAEVREMPAGRAARGVLVQLEPLIPETKIPGAGLIPQEVKGAWATIQRGASRVTERWVELENGRLRLANLPNRPMRVTIRAKGFVPFVQPRVNLSNRAPVDLGVVELRRGARVHGRVVDSWGKPLQGARIVLGRESELANPEAQTVYETDAAGFFTVRGVSRSNRRIYVASEAFATQFVDFDLPRDQFRSRKNPVRIQMQAGATIQVRVEDPAQQPMSFMMVILKRGNEVIARQRTDEDGIAAFTHLGKDHYHVLLQGRELQLSQTVTDTTGSKVYDLKMIVKE